MARSTPTRRILTLSLMGASAFALMACQPEEQVNAFVIPDPNACIAAGGEPMACETTYRNALIMHDDTAPRYESEDLCEEIHEEGNCAVSSSGGSSFVPLMVGYMMGRSSGSSSYVGKPLYPVKGGGFSPADGSVRFNGLNGTSQIGLSAFNKPAVTKGLPPMTKAQVSSRGGFGGFSGGRSGG